MIRRADRKRCRRSGWPTVLFLLLIFSCADEQPHPYSAVLCDEENTNCRCALSSWRICRETCVDPRTDRANCGTCGISCGDQVCVNGVCAADCGNLERCGDICRLPDDPLNCGTCGAQCLKNCVSNICEEHVQCGMLTNCQGYCIDTATNIKHCGQCGNDCLGLPYCNRGECSACPAGQTSCSDTCVDLKSDNGNCGRCGNWCRNDSTHHEYCEGGTCKECPSEENMSICYGQCVSLDTEQNCGDCDKQCLSGTHCYKGWCKDDR